MRVIRVMRHFGVRSFVLFIVATTVWADNGPGNPKPDVNIIGPTKIDPDATGYPDRGLPDFGLKQQNEPACAMRPGDGDCIICFYNDYRTVDVVGHEDGWIGMSESCDAGDSWRSRIVPGHPLHSSPVGTMFAADPRAIAVPGMTIHGFIGGFRDQDSGVIAVQHWLENNKEDFDFNEPARDTVIVHQGTEGRFIDKPELEFVMNGGNAQPTEPLSFTMENPELGTIQRSFPSGTLYAAFAVFTGSQSVKILVKRSFDLGQTWTNQAKKLTESQNLVSGITMTTMGNMTMAAWRQVQDVNDSDAIYYATTTNGGNSWSKPKLLTQICRFDQPSVTLTTPPALATFRTNDFPWLATDGQKIFALYTKRVGGCATGTPKVFVSYTSNGNSWTEQQLDPTAESAVGAQFMPAAFGARGKVQVAWYDTRRENIPLEPQLPFVADHIPVPGVIVNRKVDVYTARITSAGNGINISEAVRVSRYRTVRDASAPDPNAPQYEIEASFANAKMYASGFLAFIGDYIAVTAQKFRRNGNGGWEANSSPVPGGNNLTDFFVAYADNRDVRGDVLFNGSGNQSGYTPTDNEPPVESTQLAPERAEPEPILAANDAEIGDVIRRQSTEGLEDTFTDPDLACVQNLDRTRDANIYGAVIRDELRLSSVVESRPLSGIMRAIPFVARNVSSGPEPVPPDTGAKQYRLFVADQPGTTSPANLNRASFRQQPAVGPFDGALPPRLIEDVVIERNSAVARTVFMVSPEIDASIPVEIYDGECAKAEDADPAIPDLNFLGVCDVLGSITLGGSTAAGALRQPDYESTVCQATPEEPEPENCDVLVSELHNPKLENPMLENPKLENPKLENPKLENMEVENPLLENPLLENLGFANPKLENPKLENPLLENPLLENPLLENPLLENPRLENTAFGSELTYADTTAVVRNDGNVTTAYNVDATVANFTSTNGGDPVSQIIIWKQYVTSTSRDCELRPEVRNQIVATINQPDNMLTAATIEEPFAGQASIVLGPGELGFVTYRLFGQETELENAVLSGFTASSQAANCKDFNDDVGPGPGEDPVQFYECEEQIADDRERIFIEIDSTPPSFDGLVDDQVLPMPPIEANAPGGACVDPVASGLVSATDAVSPTVTVQCVNSEGDAICTAVGGMGLSVPVSNTVINPGPSPMTCTATDDVGNSASINLFLDVVDTTSPAFTSVAMNPTTVNAGNTTGTAAVNLEAGFAGQDVDGVDPAPVISCQTGGGLTSTDPFSIGSHDVTCRITDASGNFSESAYILQVLDVTAPQFNPAPEDISAPATSSSGAVVTFDVAAEDNDPSMPPIVSCTALSGSTFPLGDTAVSCTATDAAGNSTEASFTITVVDNASPVVNVPNDPVIVSIQGPSGAVVNYSTLVSVTDNVDPSPTLSCTPPSGSTFPPGDTTVTCTGTDAAGNSTTETFMVSVGYNNGVGIFANKYNVKGGSTVQLSWAWQDAAGNVNSSGDRQILRVVDCDDPMIEVLNMAGDPGSSGFRFKSDNSWEYNWQTDYPDGSPLARGEYCPEVRSELTGDTLLITPRPVSVR